MYGFITENIKWDIRLFLIWQCSIIDLLYINVVTVFNATFLFLYCVHSSTTCFGITRPFLGVGTLTKMVAMSFH
jgi:hypothetical protein